MKLYRLIVKLFHENLKKKNRMLGSKVVIFCHYIVVLNISFVSRSHINGIGILDQDLQNLFL